MPEFVNALITAGLSTLLTGLALLAVDLAVGDPFGAGKAFLVGGAFGLVYGTLAGALASYELGRARGWVELIVDLTWSSLNTLFGLAVGGILYLFFGTPSRNLSAGQGWISYAPRAGGVFGNRVLQTLGPFNLGGPGQHERMHLLQSRIFGPLYLPLFAANYVLTTAVQVLWTSTIGLVLWLLKVRPKPYLDAPAESAVAGFFGWIYYATFFELWAYATGNPSR